MRLVTDLAAWLVTLLFAGGLVWALVQLRVRRRAAILVAVACGIELVERLGMSFIRPYIHR